MAFRSGAALTLLDQLIGDPSHGVPLKLLGNRLALTAATATSKLEGRLAREADIRDAYNLAQPGPTRRGAGAGWRSPCLLAQRGATSGRWARRDHLIGPDLSESMASWLDVGQSHAQTRGRLAACLAVLGAVLDADDPAERVACLLSDIILARAL